MRRVRLGPVAILTAVLASAAGGQDTLRPEDRDPLFRLDSHTRYTVIAILDSARRAGLPTNPIESKALEGVSKRAPARLIIMRVRETFRSLKDARSALGPNASADELAAGAGALRVGITHAELSALARSGRDKQLTVPLVVLSDLITRGVSRDTASSTIFQLWQRGAADDDFLGLWRGVERDIVSGTDPGVALLNRAREVPSRGPPSAAAPSPGARPTDSPENSNR